MAVVDWRPSVLLYRAAVAGRDRAIRRAQTFNESGAHERRLREVDAVIATITLGQAALESTINEEFLTAGLVPRGSWVGRWTLGYKEIPRAHDRPAPSQPFSRVLNRRLLDLSAWRQFLLHGDEQARERLTDRLGIDPDRAHEELKASLASRVIDVADEAMTLLSSVTGVYHPTSSCLWVAHDEL